MEIWELVRRDAERGAERMVAEYGNRLLSAATLMCRNDQDAEELVFRTLERAVRKIRQFKPTGDFYKWLYTILLNFRRMDARKRQLDVVAFGTTADFPEVPTASFIDIVSAADTEEVRAAVRGLSETHKVVTVLRYFEGRTVEEIADMLGVPVGTVKSRLHHARIQLHAVLAARLESVPSHR